MYSASLAPLLDMSDVEVVVMNNDSNSGHLIEGLAKPRFKAQL